MDGRKVLIIGGSGFIGSRLLSSGSAGRYTATYLSQPLKGGVRFDTTRDRLADKFLLRGHGYTHAVLTMGVTKLDQCAQAPERTELANLIGVQNAVDDLLEASVHPIFLSSDGVFDGTRGPWTEEDPVCPTLTYGRQKAGVESYLAGSPRPWTILRLSKVISTYASERNLLSLWLKQILQGQTILCATDQVLSPIDIDDVVQVIDFVVETGTRGLFNTSGSDILTRLELLETFVAHAPASVRKLAAVRTCLLRDVPSIEPLPVNCSLLNAKLRRVSGISPVSVARTCVRFFEQFAARQGGGLESIDSAQAMRA